MRLTLLITTLIAASTLQAENTDSLLWRVEQRKAPISRLALPAYTVNPAAEVWRPYGSFTDISAGYKHNSQSQPATVQLGNAATDWQVGADAWQSLGRQGVVWGNASFTSTRRDNVKWNNCVDYQVVAPLVLGDSVGGRLTGQRYEFAGGYAANVGERWSWGAEAGYRADISYRSRDPRLKIIVSDLNLKVGGAYKISDLYTIGATAGLRVYNQESDLEFYNPLNNIRTYALTGLGTYYSRFSGNNNENAAYRFTGFTSALTLTPVAPHGLSFVGGYDYYNVEQMLRDYNNLTLGKTAVHHFYGTSMWRSKAGSLEWGVALSADWTRRISTENLFGTSVGNVYEVIASRTYYYCDEVDTELALPLQWRVSSTLRFDATPSVALQYAHESYRSPQRDTEYLTFVPSVELGVRKSVGCVMIGCDVTGAYARGDRRSCELTGLDTDTSLGTMVLNNYLNASASRSDIGASLSISRVFGSMTGSVSLDYHHVDYHSRLIDNRFAATVSITI